MTTIPEPVGAPPPRFEQKDEMRSTRPGARSGEPISEAVVSGYICSSWTASITILDGGVSRVPAPSRSAQRNTT